MLKVFVRVREKRKKKGGAQCGVGGGRKGDNMNDINVLATWSWTQNAVEEFVRTDGALTHGEDRLIQNWPFGATVPH